MKNRSQRVITIQLAFLCWILPIQLIGQTLKTLHSFDNAATSGEGWNPFWAPILYGNVLYGTTANGGILNNGTLFRVNTDGSGFTNLYNFLGGTNGSSPNSGMVISGSTIFGTVASGAIFRINLDGTGYAIIQSVAATPDALILSGTTIWGTTTGPNSLSGSLFQFNSDGSGYTNLYDFPSTFAPVGELALTGNTLYGESINGGTFNGGAIYAINTDGTGFTNLHSFNTGIYGNVGGANPEGGLVLFGNSLYGVTANGGTPAYGLSDGVVFKINTDGTGFAVLSQLYPNGGYSIGGLGGGLVIFGDCVIGAAPDGGRSAPGGNGLVYSVNTNGSALTDIYAFTELIEGIYNSDGSQPHGGLVLSGHTLYGTAVYGGTYGAGTIFRIDLPITLFYQSTMEGIIFSWNDSSCLLQACTSLNGAYTNIPSATSPYTNNVVGPQQFFRLISSQ